MRYLNVTNQSVQKGRLQKQGYNIKGIIIIISQDAFALSSCNGTKLPLISGSLRTDIRTGLLHNIMMPLMLYPCFYAICKIILQLTGLLLFSPFINAHYSNGSSSTDK